MRSNYFLINNAYGTTENYIKENKYYSEVGQDKFLEENIFKGFKNGFFIDIGAYDGKIYSNTLFFEETNGWTGINIEPIKNMFDKLIKNRPNCINLNVAVSNQNGIADFVNMDNAQSFGIDMWSGLLNTYDERDHKRNHKEDPNPDHTKIIKVKTRKLEDILDEYNIKRIHYLSIDVESAEFEVIKSIEFKKVFIDVINFENNYDDRSKPIVDYLKSKNYIVYSYFKHDIMMIHKDSPFLPKDLSIQYYIS